MLSLDDWSFEFQVSARVRIPRSLIDDLMLVAILGWAEARSLGIGGGYRPVSREVRNASISWRFRFGLCVQEAGKTIPESEAGELLELVRGWCDSRGFEFVGGFREFTPDESDPGA